MLVATRNDKPGWRLLPVTETFMTPKGKTYHSNRVKVKEDGRPPDPRILGWNGRTYQPIAFTALDGHNFTILKAPTGSGKSLIQIFLAATNLLDSNFKKRQVFVVPQRNIGVGFTEHRHKALMIDGLSWGWRVTHKCTDMNTGSVERIKTFLTEPDNLDDREDCVISGPNATVTSVAFIQAWNSLDEADKRRVAKRTVLRIDESHHMSEDEENRLGTVVRDFLKLGGAGCHLITATFFRTDKNPVLDNETQKQYGFVTHKISWLDYLRTTGITSFRQEYRAYTDGGDVMKQVLADIKAEPKEFHLVILPADTQKFFRHSHKQTFVTKLVAALEGLFGKDNVLDLISKDRQKTDSKTLITAPQKFQAVVTCAIGKEGTDWPQCSRVHNTLLDAGILVPIQKFGRALRKSNGKHTAVMTNYIPYFVDWDTNEETTRRMISDRLNVMSTVSLMDEEFYPVFMRAQPKKDGGVRPRVTLMDVYGEETYISIIEDLVTRVLALSSDKRTPDKLNAIIEKIIGDYESDVIVEVDHDDLVKRLRLKLARQFGPENVKLEYEDIDIAFIRDAGWDKVVRNGSPFVGEIDTEQMTTLHNILVERLKAQGDSEGKKKSLLAAARNGEERPHRATQLGVALANYTGCTISFDPDFDKQIRKLAPDWFGNDAARKKTLLLDMARNGETRPRQNNSLGKALRHYTSNLESEKSYDPDFDKQIRKLAPDWFKNNVTEKKKLLLAMAKNGDKRPHIKTPLGSALITYTTNTKSYDPDFDLQIRKLAPDWFREVVLAKKKEDLLAMARNGEERPRQDTPLGNVLGNYTRSTNCTYDPDFDQQIRKLAPEWFKMGPRRRK
jgi:superfamily II DNA or RNA helicase